MLVFIYCLHACIHHSSPCLHSSTVVTGFGENPMGNKEMGSGLAGPCSFLSDLSACDWLGDSFGRRLFPGGCPIQLTGVVSMPGPRCGTNWC